MTAGPEIIIGVTGGISAYKTAELVSRLVQDGVQVTVVSTRASLQFVGEATLAALSGRPVVSETFASRVHPLGAHIEIARRGELLCIAPASADFLAKAAHGLADDLLSTLYLCFTGIVLLAPAMNGEMWSKPTVQRNVEQLKTDGATIIEPEVGWLSCREQGAGRMARVDRIRQAIDAALKTRP
jgi:phosphopantothenoylcysteine decarboxylase/phosphopantothenate--cysteine ligase